MRIQRYMLLVGAALLFAVTSLSSPTEHATNYVQANLKTNVALIPIVANIEKYLSTNTIASTKRLVETLEALQSHDLYYACGLVKISEEERMKGPPKYDTFIKIQQELMSRGGELVQQAFERILVTNNLAPDEKKLMRSYLRQKKVRTFLLASRLMIEPKHANISFALIRKRTRF
jgi:hypothetical protein